MGCFLQSNQATSVPGFEPRPAAHSGAHKARADVLLRWPCSTMRDMKPPNSDRPLSESCWRSP